MTINEVVSYMIAGSILLLAFLLIINPLNTNKKGNFYFGIFLLVWSTFWLDESISLQDFKYRFYFIIFKGLIQFSTPLFFYLGIKFYTNTYFNIRKKLPTLLIFPSIYCLILIYINNSTNVVLQKIPTIIIIINALFYTILAFFSLNKHQKNIE
ncbi:MAG TPA: hypothetical protein VLZ72_01845, partial [Flavobacterium sp.]|nr:hypothetical protein [Flavobacterium sp.]